MKGFLYWSAYNNIVDTLHTDAAPGRLMNGDASACGNALAAASKDAKADPALFMLAVRQFLSSAGASEVCSVSCTDPIWHETSLGFSTKRLGDYLYVTSAKQEKRLEPGMRIAAVGENTIPFMFKDMGVEIFNGRDTDREDWDLALRMYDDVDVFPGDGHVKRLDLRKYPLESGSSRHVAPTLDVLRDGVVALRVGSLAHHEQLETVLIDGRDQIINAQRLIIDLRGCNGEADPQCYLDLLPYLCDRDCDAIDVMGPRDIYTIYSKGNVERMVALLERARDAAPDDQRDLAQSYIDEIKAKGNEVLEKKRTLFSQVERRQVSELPEVIPSPFAGSDAPVHVEGPDDVIVLVDETVGGGAELLAMSVMDMGRVRLIGRSTKGTVDYANYLTVEYPDIMASFTYPISRTVANHDGQGYARTGLPLDVHVPFTAQECTRDTLLDAACDFKRD